MITEPQHRPRSSRSAADFATLADDARVARAAAALEANGITVLRAADAADAKRIVLALIPDGIAGPSRGLADRSRSRASPTRSRSPAATSPSARRSGAWTARPRPTRSAAWRAAPDVMLGSVHAVTETGSLVAASKSGSQLGPYVSRCRPGHPRRRDAEDRVRPRRGPAPHRRVRLPARGRPRAGGVRHPQRRQQDPDHQPRDHARPHHRRPRRRGPRVLAARMEQPVMATTIAHRRARGRPRRGRARPADDGHRGPRARSRPERPV